MKKLSYRPEEAGSIKEGSYIIIDDVPCRVVEVEKSKTGKHGSAKVRIVGISIFDGSKHTLTLPAGSTVQVPIVEKKPAQVTAVLGDTVQLMDLTNYQTYEVMMPTDNELRSKIAPGVEVEVWEVMDKRFIARTK